MGKDEQLNALIDRIAEINQAVQRWYDQYAGKTRAIPLAPLQRKHLEAQQLKQHAIIHRDHKPQRDFIGYIKPTLVYSLAAEAEIMAGHLRLIRAADCVANAVGSGDDDYAKERWSVIATKELNSLDYVVNSCKVCQGLLDGKTPERVQKALAAHIEKVTAFRAEVSAVVKLLPKP